jgi:hypothetical protein
MAQHPHGPLDNPDTIHEHSDINVRAIIWFMVVLTVIVLAIDVAMWGLFRVLDHFERKNDPAVNMFAPAANPISQAPPGPNPLQTTPWTDLKTFRAEQDARLHGYGWADETAGVARVPIAKAKEMLLKQGLPVRPELADTLEGTHVAASGESNGGRTIPAGQPDKSSPVAPQAGAPAAPAAPAAPTKPGGGL